MYYCYGKGVQKSVLCREVVPYLEGPLSEVLLYLQTTKIKNCKDSAKPCTIHSCSGCKRLRRP